MIIRDIIIVVYYLLLVTLGLHNLIILVKYRIKGLKSVYVYLALLIIDFIMCIPIISGSIINIIMEIWKAHVNKGSILLPTLILEFISYSIILIIRKVKKYLILIILNKVDLYRNKIIVNLIFTIQMILEITLLKMDQESKANQ